jgi:hypothetical protein
MAFFKSKVSCDEFMGMYVDKTQSIAKMQSDDPSIVALGYLGLDMLFAMHYKKYVATTQHFRLVKAVEKMHESKWKNTFETSYTVNQNFEIYLSGAPGLTGALEMHKNDILRGYRIGRPDRPKILEFIMYHIYAAAVTDSDVLKVYQLLSAQLTDVDGRNQYLKSCQQVATQLINDYKVK